jgi:mono/diheme cytochrome c family protein
MRSWSIAIVLTLLAVGRSAAKPVDYARDVKPIFAKHCYACHGPEKQRAGLRLDTGQAARQGSDAGPVILPGKASESKLIQAVTGVADVKPMPPKGERLSAKEITVLRAWIDEGAKSPAGEAAATAKKHWAFVRPARGELSAVKNTDWVRNPIDRFVLARLEKEGIAPSPEADRMTLIRRLSLDLLGLPPSVAEVDAFVADNRPDAYERLVDRLLSSPHYGERWARHWLDMARYADSNGYSIDAPRSIWKYRDWVIDAFNRDVPFDQFTIEQIAGDMLPGATTEQRIATGFHRNTQINEEGGIDLEQFRVESIIDRVNTTGAVFLGLTIGCCQCHDHKFDAFTQREYYQMFAFLNNADEPTLELATAEQLATRKKVRARLAEVQRILKKLENTSAAKEDQWEKALTTEIRATLPKDIQAILEVPENGRTVAQKETLTEAYRKQDQARHALDVFGAAHPLAKLAHVQASIGRANLERERAALKKSDPPIISTMVMQERSTPRETHLLIQGDFTRKSVVVQPGVPAVLPSLDADPKPGGGQMVRGPSGLAGRLRTSLPNGKLVSHFEPQTPTRLDFACWLVDRQNPLTARVAVNRFWQHFFGLGIVETENDFGTQGTRPTHPELLDWLATEFMDSGWKVKAMHRLIVTSATYRQSSKSRPELATLDARNRLLARQSRLRLDAELVRDAALTASGLLTSHIGGPSVHPPQPEGIYRFTQIDKHWKADAGPARYRRGLYTYFWRSAPHPGLIVFDSPDATLACTRRNRSNTPLQALTLLNDQAHYEFAQGLAKRILRERAEDDTTRLRFAFRLCLGRAHNLWEQQRLIDLLNQERAESAAATSEERQMDAWTSVARVLLNLDEFITRE